MYKYKKHIARALFCSTVILLSACGGDNNSSTEDTGKTEIELVGIPKSMVAAVCQDTNANELCDDGENLEFLYDNEEGSSLYNFEKVTTDGGSLLLEISDPAQTNHFDKYVMSFPSDSEALSMQSFIDDPNVVLKTPDLNQDFFLALAANINLLGQNGIEAREGIKRSKGKMANEWTIANFSDVDFEEEELNLIDILTFSQKEAYQLANEIRSDNDKALVNDKLAESYQCKTTETRTVKNYGFEDIFDLSNGIEPAYPSAHVSNYPSIVAYNTNVNAGFAQYDDTNNNRFFAENINNLPSNITDGRIFIGLKSNGSALQGNDTLHIGDYGNNHYGSLLADLSSTWSHQLVSSTNPTTDIYWNDFSALNFSVNTNTTVLDYVQSNSQFDVVIEDDTSVDFITVVTCSEAEPLAEIKPVLDNFQCKASAGADNETKHTIIGGTVDAFATAGDLSSTPSSALVNAISPYPSTDYDATAYDKFLIETLSLPTSGYITIARLSVGVKALGSSLHSNDSMHIGYTHTSDKAGFTLYGNAANSVNNQWNVTPISNGERVLQSDFSFNMQSGTNALAWLRGESSLDVVIEDDTAVDFIQLDLCTTEKPPFLDTDGDGFSDDEEIEAGSDPDNESSTPNDFDGDGVPNDEDCDPFDPDLTDDCKPKLPQSCDDTVSVDLRSASSWLNTSGVAPTENNVFDGTQWEDIVWDGDMNWFDYGSASNAEHKLSIDFCSCGGGDINVTNMKSDNYGSVTLDNNLPAIVEQTAYSQSTMASWGTDVSGTKNIPFSGNGTDHSLNFTVTNVGGPSGGAIDGTLTFVGHLGACTASDVLNP